MTMPHRDTFDMVLQARLAEVLDIQVGLSDVPSETPEVPYLVLEWSPSPGPEGSYANPEDMPYWDYLIKSVGRNHRETARTASRSHFFMVGRGNSGYAYEITVAGLIIVRRETISTGMIIKAPSPELFEVNDIYRICVNET